MLIVAKVILYLSGCKVEKIHEIMEAWAKPAEMSRYLKIRFSTGPLTADLEYNPAFSFNIIFCFYR